MVFGWGKKKTEQEIIESQKEKQIKLSEIKGVLDDVVTVRTKTIVAEVKPFKKKIESHIDEVLKIITDLKQDDLKADELDKRLQVIVVRGKEEVISTIQNECKVKFSDILSLDDVLEFNENATQILKKIGDVLGKNSKIIHLFAKKYASKLKDILAAMTSIQSEIQELVDNNQRLQNDISKVLSNISLNNELQKTLTEKHTRISELNKNVEKYDIKIKELRNEIEKTKASKEYLDFLKTKNIIDNLESEKNQLKNEINTQFTKISRPLSRYEYVSSFDKPQKQLLEKLVTEPFEVLNIVNKENIVNILLAAKKSVQGGSVSVKDSEKTITNIDETLSSLDSYISKILEFSHKKEETEKKLSDFNNEKLEVLEKDASKNLADKQDAESKIQNLEKELSEIKQKIPEIIFDIERKLQTISGTKYKILTN
ncbi:MAG: exonuclease SbcC [Nitrosopumilaceae archaeon]